MKTSKRSGKKARVIILFVLIGVVLLSAALCVATFVHYGAGTTLEDIKALDELQRARDGVSDYQGLIISAAVGTSALLILILDIVSIRTSNKQTARIAGRS